MTRKIAFLGCGSMGEAILAGLLGAGQSPSAVTVTVRRTERAAELAARHQVTAIAATEEPEANSQAAKGADVVVLGVKPLGIAALCREIAPALSAGTVVISIAAAVSLEQLAAALPDGQPVVRSMPNTPLRVGRGVVALSAGPSVSAGQLALARGIFSGAGTVLEVPEEQQNAVSAISGSGPAYMFYLAESLAAAARDLGLDADMALVLAKETIAGAGLMLAQEGADPTELRRAVTSPNGTTERAIATFEDRGLPAIIGAGARAAADRAAAITEELG
jgi:pyrroline-5-carboxylate reductase